MLNPLPLNLCEESVCYWVPALPLITSGAKKADSIKIELVSFVTENSIPP